MNREEKRVFARKAVGRGIPKEYAEMYANMLDTYDRISNSMIFEGDMVKVDVGKITSREDYESMNVNYKEFVESSEGVVFTAHVEKEGCLISLKENPRWLFWVGDLVRVD